MEKKTKIKEISEELYSGDEQLDTTYIREQLLNCSSNSITLLQQKTIRQAKNGKK